MGWYSMIVVDGTPYMLMGIDTTGPNNTAKQTAVIMTPTRTSFLFEAGSVEVNATYLSPVVVRSIILGCFSFCASYSAISSQTTLYSSQCRSLTTTCPLPLILHMRLRCTVTFLQVCTI